MLLKSGLSLSTEAVSLPVNLLGLNRQFLWTLPSIRQSSTMLLLLQEIGKPVASLTLYFPLTDSP